MENLAELLAKPNEVSMPDEVRDAYRAHLEAAEPSIYADVEQLVHRRKVVEHVRYAVDYVIDHHTTSRLEANVYCMIARFKWLTHNPISTETLAFNFGISEHDAQVHEDRFKRELRAHLEHL